MILSDPAREPRVDRDELLDETGHDPADLADSLREIDRVNRWLGGLRPLRAAVGRVESAGGGADGAAAGADAESPARPLRILDVGTGSGMVPRELVRSGGRGRRPRTAVGVDVHPQIVRYAARAGRTDGSATALPVVRADGRALPFRAGSFDVVLCTLTLHHLDERAAVRLLQEMGRVARRRVLVSDLERSRANYLGARLLAATLWRRSPVTRNDGPLSVLRSFTAEELEGLARTAGLRDVRVRRHFPFRLLLESRPAGGER